MAGTEIGSLFYDLLVDDSKLQGQLDEADKKMGGFSDNIKSVGTKVGVAFAAAGAGLTLFAKNATNFTEDYVKSAKALSRETGATIQDSSRLLAVTSKLGLSADQVSTTFGILSKKINEAGNNTEANRIATEKLNLEMQKTQRQIDLTNDAIKKSGDKNGDLALKVKMLQNNLSGLQDQLSATTNPLDQLQISTQRADGTAKTFNDILLEVSDKFHTMPDGATKTALAMELFGRSGKDMIKFLNLGSAAISDMEKEADKLGLTLTPNTVDKISNLIQSQKQLKEQTDAIKISVGTLTAPILTDFNMKMNDVLNTILTSDGPWKGLTANVLAFGGPILTATGGLIGFLANLDQALPAIIAITSATGGFIVEVGLLTLALAPLLVTAGAIVLAFVGMKNAILGAASAWDNASAAASNYGTSQDMVISQLKGLIKSGTPAQKARAKTALKNIATQGSFASGVTNFEGGLAYVHQGELLVNMPKGTDVIKKSDVNNMSGPTVNIGTVNDRSDADYILRRIDRNNFNRSIGVSPI